MLHTKPSENHKQDRISKISEAGDLSDDPNAEDKTDDSLSIESDRSRSCRSSNSTPSKRSSPLPTTPNNKGATPDSVTGKQQLSSSSRKSVTPPSGKPEKSNKKRRPRRPGIVWREGGKIEARESQKKWYPARIVEVDDSDSTVLVHFDGWNQRFDEWLDMDSERLRPSTRHSGRQQKKEKAVKAPPKADYKAGENVFAKWTDCRMYPARIMAVKSPGMYDVLFYDGFRKNVQNINIRLMSQEVQEEYSKAGLLAEPKKMKQKMAMFEKLAEKERLANEERERRKKVLAGTSLEEDESVESEKNEKEKEKTPKTEKKPNKEEEKQSASPQEKKLESPKEVTSGVKRKKFPGAGSFLARKKSRLEKKESKKSEVSDKEEEGVRAEGQAQKRREGVVGKKITKVRSVHRGELVKRKVKRQRPKGLKTPKTHTQPKALALDESMPTSSEGPVTPASAEPLTPTTPSPEEATSSTPAASGSNEASDPDSGQASTSVPPKAFLIEDDHNKYKCPFPDCGKGFRKKSLVDYHVKYYHTDDGTPVQAPPPKKRKKTFSQCSEADSEISVGAARSSVGKPRTKKVRDSMGSIPSVPSTPGTPQDISVSTSTPPPTVTTTAATAISVPKEIGEISIPELVEESQVPDNISEETKSTTTTTEGYEHHAELLHEESVDTADEPDSPHDRLAKDEVVNCICQLNEENGLMIQCDVCLCWQHAVCMDITEETLPKKYLCYVCINPPGVRESARYAYDQDWLKQGTMARFGMLPEELSAPQKAHIMKATHELAGDMHNITRVLNALKRKLFALKHRRNPEFRMWSKDWDKEAERLREEQSQAEQQHAFENENSLINVDDDFSQIIGSELLEQLARTSMEIIAKSGGKLPGADDATNRLVSQAGFSLGHQGEMASTSDFGLEASADVSHALAPQGDQHSSFDVSQSLSLESPELVDHSLAPQGTFSQVPTSSHGLPGQDKLDQAVTNQLPANLTSPSLTSPNLTSPSLTSQNPLIPTVVSSISSDSLENETATTQSQSRQVTGGFALPVSSSIASTSHLVSQVDMPQTSTANKDLGGSVSATGGSEPPISNILPSSGQLLVTQPVGSSPQEASTTMLTTQQLSQSLPLESKPTSYPPLSSISPLSFSSQLPLSSQLNPQPQQTPIVSQTPDLQVNPVLQLTSKPQLTTPTQLTSGSQSTSAQQLTLHPPLTIEPHLTSDSQLTTHDSQLASDPQLTSDPLLTSNPPFSSNLQLTSDPILQSDTHMTSNPSLPSDPPFPSDPQLACELSLPLHPSLPVDDSSASFSLDSEPKGGLDLQLDTSATESCAETEDPGVLSMDTSDPVGDIIGSQDIVHALSNPSMLDDVDPTKLLDDHPDDVPAPEDPKVICEQNLMEHILRHQDTVESRLDLIEEQILALESAEDGGNRSGELMKDLPRVKKIMHQMLSDLLKVKRMALYH